MQENRFEMRLPHWLKKKAPDSSKVHSVKSNLRKNALHTVCEEASCPNLGECFSRGTAAIMVMGGICTRRCGFCAVKGGTPLPLDPGEPARVANQLGEMGLKHAVVTSVTRDDLADGGACHFASTICEIRKISPKTVVEVLTPDFLGQEKFIKIVCDAAPNIYNHNLETIERITPIVRNKADYKRSLDVLSAAKKFLPEGLIKSGLMLGLGEKIKEVVRALEDLKNTGVSIVTLGQYLRPAKDSIPVTEYIRPDIFEEYKKMALGLGFKFVFSGPFVRSSYLADSIDIGD